MSNWTEFTKKSLNQPFDNTFLTHLSFLGCFNKTYYSEQNLPSIGWFTPDNPDNLDITIMHFVDLDNKGQKLRFNSTKIDKYKKDAKVYFVVHGWQSGFSYESWLDDMCVFFLLAKFLAL